MGQKRIIGLDIGSGAVKGVALALSGKRVALTEARVFDCRAEGILNEAELLNSVSGWLEQLGWLDDTLIVGMPQYLATTQVSDFPPGATTGLAEMVEFETQQLAGLSDDVFLHDYQVMEPKFGRHNPVLIGICRESAVRDRIEMLTNAGISASDLAMSGIAVANAFFGLYPDAVTNDEPQLLLDLGAENATLSVIAGGQVLFVGSLMFGGERLTELLAKELGVDPEEGEKLKHEAQISLDDPGSVLYKAGEQLDSEMTTVLDHWRAQERDELADRKIVRCWLSGGGAKLRGMDRFLAEKLGCPVSVFGPVVPDVTDPDPALATAFGLALHGIGRCRAAISLSPPEMRWLVLRKRYFAYLAVSAALIVLMLVGGIVQSVRFLASEQRELGIRLAELNECERLIPQLENTRNAIRYHEMRLVPFVERGNRARKFIAGMNGLAAACGEADWFIYFADDASYQEGKTTEKERQTSSKTPATPKGGMGLFGGGPAAVPGIGDTVSAPEFPRLLPVEDLPRVESIIIAGYTPLLAERPYESVRGIVKNLDEMDHYNGVDLLPEVDRIGREDIFEPWVAFFKQHPGDRYKAFTLRLPFASLEVNKRDAEVKQ